MTTLPLSGARTAIGETAVYRGGYWLALLLLVLLPVQRLMIPFGLALADFVLLPLVGYVVLSAWRNGRSLTFPLLLPMLLILVASGMATAAGLAHFDSVIAILQELYIFVWFWALVNVLRWLGETAVDRLLKVWSVVAALEAITTVMGMFQIGPAMFYTKPYYDPADTESVARAVGVHMNSNAAAVYLSVSVFAALATTWPLRRRILLAGWIYAGMFATGSNGALLSTAVALLILLFVYQAVGNRRVVLLWGGAAALAAGVGVLLLLIWPAGLLPVGMADGSSLLFYTIGRFRHSLAVRVEIARWAWQIYHQSPWGIGPNGYSTLLGSLHNDYLAFWFERGPLGLFGWLLLIGVTLGTAVAHAGRQITAHARWRLLTLGAGFLACMINAFSHEVSHMRQVWILIAFLFALYAAARRPVSGGNQI